MKNSSKRVLIGAMALAIAALGARPALAEKLVIFKNGKALRVKSVTQDGKWLRLEFDGKDFMAIPFSGVASIEDSISNAGVGEMKLNQVAAGSGGGGGGGGYVPPQRTEEPGLPPDVAAGQEQHEEDAQAALAEELAAKQNQQVNGYAAPGLAIGNRRGRAMAQQQQQLQPGAIPGIPGGLQPIGTQVNSPFNNNRNGGPTRNRGLNQGRPSN